MAIRTVHQDAESRRLPMISKDARIVVRPGVDAWDATLGYVRRKPGEANVPHAHETSEDTIVILEGEGTARDSDSGRDLPFPAGCMVRVPAGIRHAELADRGCEVVRLAKPAPADRQRPKRIGAFWIRPRIGRTRFERAARRPHFGDALHPTRRV